MKFVATVQRVRAIGKPPADMLCLFRDLKNVVVLPSVGAPKIPCINCINCRFHYLCQALALWRHVLLVEMLTGKGKF